MIVPGFRFCSLQMLAVLFWCTVSCADREHSFNEHQDESLQESAAPLITGAGHLLEHYVENLKDKRIGLIANPASRVGDTHFLDLLLDEGVNVTALFAPEHGFRGDRPAGEEIRDGADVETGLPVYSLYGTTRKPTAQMLEDIDILLFDIQDVGVRFYTYISTLGLVLEAAAEHNVEVWITDRPNPLGGLYVSGWVMQEPFKSFVGMYPIPVVHGMSIGEIALMISNEQWINTDKEIEPKVIRMENWKREMIWPDTQLPWIPPSPNLPHFTNALVYPGTCFFEGSTLSEGRGTKDPFMITGSPGVDISDEFKSSIENRYPVLLERAEFTPESIPGMAVNPKFEGKLCKGVRISPQTLDPMELRPLEMGLELFRGMMHADPDAETLRFLYNLSGTTLIDDFLSSSEPPEVYWQEELDLFRELRQQYLLY